MIELRQGSLFIHDVRLLAVFKDMSLVDYFSVKDAFSDHNVLSKIGPPTKRIERQYFLAWRAPPIPTSEHDWYRPVDLQRRTLA